MEGNITMHHHFTDMQVTNIHYYNRLIKMLRWYKGLDMNVSAGLTENHHIVPKCIGGEDRLSNRVILPTKAHVILHQLYFKSFGGKSLALAFLTGMRRNGKGQTRRGLRICEIVTSNMWKDIRPALSKHFSDIHKGKPKSQKVKDLNSARMKANNPMKNPITAAKVGVIMKGLNLRHDHNTPHNYKLVSPLGKVFETKSLAKFCCDNNLNRDILMKHCDTGEPVPPIAQLGRKPTESRINTIGWYVSKSPN